MARFVQPACWALAMVLLAIGARFGWADRQAVQTLLLIMPILAVTGMLRRGRCLRAEG